MSFINGLTLLLLYQLAGEIGVRLLDIPMPGPVLGMMMLLLTLIIRGRSSTSLDESSSALLSHFSLLFVPAGVGMMVHFNRISNEWFSIGMALLLSTVITMFASVIIMLAADRLFSGKPRNND